MTSYFFFFFRYEAICLPCLTISAQTCVFTFILDCTDYVVKYKCGLQRPMASKMTSQVSHLNLDFIGISYLKA